MTDKNGKPLKVGDKVTHPDYASVADVMFFWNDSAELRNEAGGFLARADSLTLVEPAVEHIGTNVFESLQHPEAAQLYAKAELVSRVRDIMDGFERSRFSQIADEILKAVAAYHEP